MQRDFKEQHGKRNDQTVRVYTGQILCVLLLQLSVLLVRTKTATTTFFRNLVLLARHCATHCFNCLFGVPLRHSTHGGRRNDNASRPGSNQNEISISIIPTSEFFPSHRKMFVIASQPAVNHLTPVVA